MKLTSFQVQKFRNIIDSEEIAIQTDVTSLVGKNESGKTALLNALYRLNPAYGELLDESADYPRWLLTADRKKGAVNDANTITAKFELEANDIAAVEAVFGHNALKSKHFSYTRGYNGTTRANLIVNDEAIVKHFLDDASAPSTAAEPFREVKSLDDLRAAVEARLTKNPADVASDDVAAALTQLGAGIAALLGKGTTWQAVVQVLVERLPTFFYFSEYSFLPGRIDLRTINDGDDGPARSANQTARALLNLAGTSTESLTEENYEERTAELEAVSNELTSQVFEYWSQNEDLEVVIDVDKETVDDGTGRGSKAVARYLDVRVKDRRHGFTSNFSQRSAGFRWFFSFLAAFSEFEAKDERVVVLLDEPGLALHARAQADFLRFIEERLAPTAQVIYTTHSPFMIEAGHLERVRVVEDKGSKLGTVVSSEVLTVDSDTLFPLQAALGYDIAQNLFIGRDNLVVEGTSDFTYLTVVSDHLKSLGRESLDATWRILPAGGVTNVPSFVALMGRQLDVTVFVDSTASGLQKLNNLAAKGLLSSKRLLTVAGVLGTKGGDIEDLFSPGDYLKMYNAAFGVSLTVAKLEPGDRIIDQIGRTEGKEFTEHGLPADYLLRNRDKILDQLTESSLSNFEAAIKAINATKAT